MSGCNFHFHLTLYIHYTLHWWIGDDEVKEEEGEFLSENHDQAWATEHCRSHQKVKEVVVFW